MIKYFCLFFLFLTTAVKSPGQSDNYRLHHKVYTTDDGLSSRFIQDIYQDTRGFIWVSSDYGVNRFDGQKFEVYNQGKYKLQSDNINEIREDQAGNLWFINRDLFFKDDVLSWRKVSIDVLNYYENTIVSIEEYLGEAPPFNWSNVVRIEQDESYSLWITTRAGKVYRYTDHFTEVPIESDLITGGVLSPLPDSAGFIILGIDRIIKLNEQRELVYEVDLKGHIISFLANTNGHIFLIVDGYRIIYEIDNKGQLTLLTGEGVESDQEFKVGRFGKDSKGRIWLEGLDDGKLTLYEDGRSVLDSELNKFTIGENVNNRHDFFGDIDGGIWYGDLNGLNYISLNKAGFTSYFRDFRFYSFY